jgi:UDP-2,3-diacylglucosamine hydrolase
MKPALFLSDLHLSPDRPDAAAAFHAFARGPARSASSIYILGDLFDWWLGDDQLRDPFAQAVAKSLRETTDAGVPVFVARGNRDFLLGAEFERATGARLLPEQRVVDVGGTDTLLLHGDELCTDDADYQRYRARIRTPAAARRLLALPYFARRGVGWYLRRASRDANALKPEAIMDVSEDAVAAAFRQHRVTRMIHGHTHRPARHVHTVDGIARERIVLADWHDRGHYVEADAEGLRAREISG